MTNTFKIVACLSIVVLVLSLLSVYILNRTINIPDMKSKKVVSPDIRVAVLNGCGRPELASLFARILRNEGFDVINGQGENADSFDFDISVVVDRKGSKSKAESVAQALGITEILDQRSNDPYLIEDVVVVLGRDWNTLHVSKEDVTD